MQPATACRCVCTSTGWPLDAACVCNPAPNLSSLKSYVSGSRCCDSLQCTAHENRFWALQTVCTVGFHTMQAPGDEGQLVLDQLLVGALFNKKEPQTVGDAHPRDDVLQRLLGKLLLFTHVVRPTENVRLVLL